MPSFLFPRSWTQWIGPIAACGGVAGVLALLVLMSGVADLSASTPHPAGWAATLHFAFQRSVAHHAEPDAVPADLDSPAMVMKGATYYARACSHCHGAPDLGQNPVALMMRPRPQYLPAVVGQFTPAELFYIVKHGVKYSAMPAWPTQSRDDEVWPVVAFLRAINHIRLDQYRALATGDSAGVAAPAMPFGAPGPLKDYALYARDQPSDSEHRYGRPAMGFDSFALDGHPVTTCAACHGSQGAGRPGARFPNLTIQTETYLRDTLTAFADGKRKSAYMQTVATQLSPDQIDALARYYGGMAATPATDAPPPAPMRQRGAQIAAYGIKAKGVGACTSCHGATRQIGDAIPRLAGQSVGYMIDQMRVFRSGGRGESGGVNPMVALSAKLSDGEIAAIAAYYSTTSPAAKPIVAAQAAAAAR